MSRGQLPTSLLAALGALGLAARLAVWTFPQAAPAQEEKFVTVDSGGLTLMHRGPLQYPREAFEKNIQGPVVLEISIDQKGLVYDAHVLSGPDELRRAALQYVLQWHYLTGAALPAKAQVTVNFQPPEKVRGEGRVELGRRVLPRQVEVSPLFPDLGVVRQIEVRGLSDEARDVLVSKLPVRVGDPLTPDARERIIKVVAETDEHLLVSYQRHPEGGAILFIFLQSSPPPPPSGFAAGRVIGQTLTAPPPAATTAVPQRIRVGGNVQKANLIERKPPVYPPEAKQARIQGTVVLEVLVGRDGRVSNITVMSGHPLLIPAALEAVKEWVYQPTLLNGSPVEVLTQVEVNFTLAPDGR